MAPWPIRRLAFFSRVLARLRFEFYDAFAKLFALIAELGQLVAKLFHLDLLGRGGGDFSSAAQIGTPTALIHENNPSGRKRGHTNDIS